MTCLRLTLMKMIITPSITSTDHCHVLGGLDHGVHVAKAVSDVCCMTLNQLQPNDRQPSDTDEDDHHTINHQY